MKVINNFNGKYNSSWQNISDEIVPEFVLLKWCKLWNSQFLEGLQSADSFLKKSLSFQRKYTSLQAKYGHILFVSEKIQRTLLQLKRERNRTGRKTLLITNLFLRLQKDQSISGK